MDYQGVEDHEILGYDEPSVSGEEFWFYSTVRDAGELIRKHGAKAFLDELQDKERNLLIKEIINNE